MNLASYLAFGRFDPGWKYYETRFKACKEFEQLKPPTSGPRVKSFDQLPRAGDPELIVWVSKVWEILSNLFDTSTSLEMLIFLLICCS